MSPGPTRATVPSPTSISVVPESEIAYCRRGAQGGAGAVDEGKEGGTSKALKIFGLLLNLTGIVLLFLFEIPFRVVATGSKTVPWWSSIDVQVKKLDDIYTVLGWIGLLTLVLGTLLQILAALPRRW
jgi:hypothetical protein